MKRLTLGLAVVALACSFAGSHACEASVPIVWDHKAALPTGSQDYDGTLSLALDSAGIAHVIYDRVYGGLEYVTWDGSWGPKTVLYTGSAGTSLALDGSDNPAVSFESQAYSGKGDLMYAYDSGGPWTVEGVGEKGTSTSLAFDSSGHPHMSYYNSTTGALKYAYNDASGWQTESVDAPLGVNVGMYTSLALDSSGYAHISYYDSSNGDLKYAAWDGSAWQIQTLDSLGDVGIYTSLALDSGGYAHISYMDWGNTALKYVYENASGWQPAVTLDNSGAVGHWTSLALDSNDNPRIAYMHWSNWELRFAGWDGSSWDIQVVDPAGSWYAVGLDPSMVLDSGDKVHIAYYAANGEVRYVVGTVLPEPSTLAMLLGLSAVSLLRYLWPRRRTR